jgi:hypothetical protein
MLRRRLGATVSAMILAMHIGSPVAADPSVEQLVEIKELLTANDVAALRSYLDRYPELLEGDTELAVLLRRFLLESKHLPNYLLSDSDSDASGGARRAESPRAGAPGRDSNDDGGRDPDDPDDGIY